MVIKKRLLARKYKDVKKYFFVFACIMMVVQNVKAQEYFSSASDFARLYIGEVEPQYLLSAWRDIPYYKGTTDLYEGRISYHGVVYDHVKLRFDQLEQRVVILSPIGNVFCIPEQEHIDWFEMDGQRFVHDPEDDSRYAAFRMEVRMAPSCIILRGRFAVVRTLSKEGNTKRYSTPRSIIRWLLPMGKCIM